MLHADLDDGVAGEHEERGGEHGPRQGEQPRLPQVQQELERGALPDLPRPEHLAAAARAQHVALRPAGALPHQRADGLGAFLLDVGERRHPHVPPAHGEGDHEVEVLGERVGPGRPVDGVERGEAGELAVPAEAHRPGLVATHLRDGRRPPEADVLDPGEEVLAVADADLELDAADGVVVEQAADQVGGAGGELTVRVHHADDHPVRVEPPAGDLSPHDVEGGVERRSLADAGVGQPTAQHDDAVRLARDGVGDLGGAVGGRVVDHHDHRAVVLGQQRAWWPRPRAPRRGRAPGRRGRAAAGRGRRGSRGRARARVG
nr:MULTISPECIES: hypothetical protein [Cellulosimicrobium]